MGLNLDKTILVLSFLRFNFKKSGFQRAGREQDQALRGAEMRSLNCGRLRGSTPLAGGGGMSSRRTAALSFIFPDYFSLFFAIFPFPPT